MSSVPCRKPCAGVAYPAANLGSGIVYMPVQLPTEIKQVKMFIGNLLSYPYRDTFDDANTEALRFCDENKMLHPPLMIHGSWGKGTGGIEIMQQSQVPVDYLFVPVGGGGLASGLGAYFKQISPDTKIIGVEPAGAASMAYAFKQGKVVPLERIDGFIDGAAVKKAGYLTYDICKKVLDDIISVPEGAVCSTILDLYNLNT